MPWALPHSPRRWPAFIPGPGGGQEVFLTDDLNTVEEERGSPVAQGQGLECGEAAVLPSEHRTVCPSQCGPATTQPTVAGPCPSRSLGSLIKGTGTVLSHPVGWRECRRALAEGQGGHRWSWYVVWPQATKGCPWIGRLQCVQCRPCATSRVSPSSPPLLLLPNTRGPSVIQTCTTSPHAAQGQAMSFADLKWDHQ